MWSPCSPPSTLPTYKAAGRANLPLCHTAVASRFLPLPARCESGRCRASSHDSPAACKLALSSIEKAHVFIDRLLLLLLPPSPSCSPREMKAKTKSMGRTWGERPVVSSFPDPLHPLGCLPEPQPGLAQSLWAAVPKDTVEGAITGQ